MENSLARELIRSLHRVVPGSRAVALPVDIAHEKTLFEAEAGVVARAVDRRKAQFATGRAAARLALIGLGLHAGEIGTGEQRQPLWPAGVVGAISHTNEWAVAWLAQASSRAGLGVDVEAAERLPEQTWPMIFSDREAESIKVTGKADLLATAGFSVKESIYKAIFPVVRRFVDFKEVFLLWDQGRQAFRIEPDAQLTRELKNRSLEAGFFTIEELVTSWAVLKD